MGSKKLEVDKIWTLCSAHITARDIGLLLNKGDSIYPYSAAETEYGVIVWVPADDYLPPKQNSVDFILDSKEKIPAWCPFFSKELIEILRFAQKNQIRYVYFDCDGDELEDFPLFDW